MNLYKNIIRMGESTVVDNKYDVRAFLGKDLESILARVENEMHIHEGLLHWVSFDTTLEISNGKDTIDMGIYFWDEASNKNSLDKLSNIIEILKGFEAAIERALPEYLELKEEVKKNRNENTTMV
jgi:hypothetical protein